MPQLLKININVPSTFIKLTKV